MNVKTTPLDYYSNKKYRIDLSCYYNDGGDDLNIKIDELKNHLSNGFTLYSTNMMKRFLQGYSEIEDFGIQFVLLHEYYQHNNN